MANEKIQELQMLEQSLQSFLYQKQAFQMELTETEAAIKELKDSGEDVFKIVGQLMIKTEKKKTQEELDKKHEMLNLRLKSLDKQEEELSKQAETLRAEVMKDIKKK